MFSTLKKSNNNKTIKLKCAETGNKPESVNTEKNVNMLTEKMNLNRNRIFLSTTKQEIVNFSIKKVPVLMELDVFLFMSTKTKWKN